MPLVDGAPIRPSQSLPTGTTSAAVASAASAEVAALSDLDLLFAARKAARAHDTAAFEPLFNEVARRPSLLDEITPLINELYPPVPHGKYVPVRVKNAMPMSQRGPSARVAHAERTASADCYNTEGHDPRCRCRRGMHVLARTEAER